MPNSDVFAFQRSGFDRFLCASVGTEPNGADLNLMSVFARLGDDPWREAGRLFEMPKAEAINSLAQTIATMPASIWDVPNATTIAGRLVVLLPAELGVAASLRATNGARAALYLRKGLLHCSRLLRWQ